MSWRTPSNDLGTHICIQLINLVKKHPIIYSSEKSAPYPRKNRNEMNRIWEKIAREVGLSAGDCKKRWKGLKDVYAKIRKRRLQEGVLGINSRRKWIYEDFMSFMKFPFEKSYQKALENFEAETESNDTIEEELSDTDCQFRVEEEEEQIEDGTIEYLDLDLQVESIPDSEEHDAIEGLKTDDSLENNSYVQVSVLKEESGHDSADINPRSRYRAIRPKPYQPNLLSKNRSVGKSNAVVKNSTSSMIPVVSVSNLNPLNQIIVTSPTLRKSKNDTVILSSPNMEMKDYGKEASDGVSSTSPGTMKSDGLRNTRVDSSLVTNKRESLLRISAKKSSSSSLELFFQSMAQTMMSLPMQVQAEIKMKICKIVTEAEIQYSLSQSTSTLESHKSKSKKRSSMIDLFFK